MSEKYRQSSCRGVAFGTKVFGHTEKWSSECRALTLGCHIYFSAILLGIAIFLDEPSFDKLSQDAIAGEDEE